MSNPRASLPEERTARGTAVSLTLVFEATPIARVVQEDCELVTITGTYTLLEGAREQPAAMAWHEACVDRASSRNAGRDPGTPPENANLTRPDAWAMVDAQGARRPIAVPDFLSGNRIVWRWC